MKKRKYLSPLIEVETIESVQMIAASNTERLSDGTPGWGWEEDASVKEEAGELDFNW